MITTIMIAAAAGVVGASAGAILMGLLLGRKTDELRARYAKLAAAENARQAPLRAANAKRRADAAAKVGA